MNQMASIILTAHNEGDELQRTIESIRRDCAEGDEIVVVNDGSTDGSFDSDRLIGARTIWNEQRTGVAFSRDRAAREASGHVLAFFDGHQRVSRGCIERTAELAISNGAIVWPDVRGFEPRDATLHGASFRLCPRRGLFTARWRTRAPHREVTRITALRCPGYVIPRRVYERVRWIRGLRSWGGSEAAISLKAFFLDIPILHLCGPVAQHMFKKKLDYEPSWDDVWRNHALIARVCFAGKTWNDYWLPEVFDGHLTDEARNDMESADIVSQHEEFQQQKVRSDQEFWTSLIHQPVPACLR
jgi:glycosyltransferase involved in cell wall biosynthesis